MNNHQTENSNWLSRAICVLSANHAVFAISLIGFGLEASLVLSFAADRTLSLTLATLALLGWVWLTIGWCLHFAVRWVRNSGGSTSVPFSLAVKAGGFLIGTLLVFGYLASWAFYFRAERFATIENARFFWANLQSPVLWWYFITSEPVALSTVCIALCLFAVLIVMSAERIAATGSPAADPSRLASTRRTAWWAQLLVIALMVIYLVGFETSDSRRFQGIDWLGRRANPVVSLAVSMAEASLDTSIEPCLDEEMLVQIDTPWSPPSDQQRQRPVVIFVAVESLRFDAVHRIHQGKKIMPNLSDIATRSIEFTRAYTQSTHSDYADVAVLSSLYPLRTRHHHYYRKTDPWPKKLLYDLLHDDGYRTAIVSAQNEAWGGMSFFLETPGLDLFYDAERSGLKTKSPGADFGFAGELESGTLTAGKLDDRDVTRRALQWMSTNQDVPFFLSINYQSSHFPYLLSDPVERPFVPCEIDFDASFMYYPPEKTEIVRNAYYNALHLIDEQIGILAKTIEQLGIGPLILVVYGENGEAFHENGCVTHAKPPFEPMVHVPCIFYAPDMQEPRQCNYPMQLIDVVPTVLGQLGLPPHSNFQGIDVLAAQRPAINDRDLFLHTELQGVSRVDAIVHAGRWKLHHNRERNQFLLFDLETDSGETNDLIESRADIAEKLVAKLAQWRAEQLAYYHFPHYYERFYPP